MMTQSCCGKGKCGSNWAVAVGFVVVALAVAVVVVVVVDGDDDDDDDEETFAGKTFVMR